MGDVGNNCREVGTCRGFGACRLTGGPMGDCDKPKPPHALPEAAMVPAFQSMTLPIGAYQMMTLVSADLGDQFTEGGKEPRTLVCNIKGMGAHPFEFVSTTLLLSEKAQVHIIAALRANLDGDSKRARELIAVFHPEYGAIEQ